MIDKISRSKEIVFRSTQYTSEGGVGDASDHSSSTRQLDERGFRPRGLLERHWGRGRAAVVAMCSCGHQSVCKNNTSQTQ